MKAVLISALTVLFSVAISMGPATSASRDDTPKGDGLKSEVSKSEASKSDLQTGRSVAVAAPQRYWLSDDLSRIFLQKPARGEAGHDTLAR